MRLVRFLARVEGRIRDWFIRRPIFYSLIGGIGVVLFWRGVWHSADAISAYAMAWNSDWPTTDLSFPLDALFSIVLGTILLLASGLFVSTFLGNEITISGLRGEKKLTEKTEVEVRTETGAVGDIRHEIRVILRRLEAIDKKIDGKVDSKRQLG